METLNRIYESIRKFFPTEEFYLVGGCARDTLLNKTPKDYDVATSMTPDYMKQKLKDAGRHVYEIGSKYGSIGFKAEIEKGKFQYVEMTTYRSEFYNPKDRHPKVKFIGDLKSDLERRDFTINALAYSPETGIIDCFGGRVDIFEKVIKSVGKSEDRFKEDPLRMLRAIRFATVLDFEIEHNLMCQIRKRKFSLLDVAVERWIIELDKILEATNPERGIKLLVESGLWSVIFPEIPEDKAISLKLSNWPTGDYRLRELLKLTGHTQLVKKGVIKDIYRKELYLYIGKGIVERLKLSNKRKEFLLDTNKRTDR